MWFGIYLNVLFTLCMLKLVGGKPFVYNGPRALATWASSASATASGPSEPLTNISDLRRKQQKAEALQQEKQLATEENDNDAFLEGEENETNEAAPSIFQKKINKILTKIRLISSLSGAVSGGSGGGNDETTTNDKDDDFRRELEEFDKEFENDVLNMKDVNNTESVPTFQKVIYPHSNSAPPVKVSFDINPRIVNRKQSQVVDEIDDVEFDDMAETMGKLGQVGVFFAELLGSVVGLVYGAAAQINNIAQGTTTTSII